MQKNKKRMGKTAYYLNIAKAVAQRSTCLRRHYGCVIVKNDEIIATGYNGAARNEQNCCDAFDECPRKCKEHNTGNYGDCPAVHAEQNAMLSASRNEMIGATMYLFGEDAVTKDPLTDCCPCPICSRMISNAGIETIVTLGEDRFITTKVSDNHSNSGFRRV